MYFNMNLEKKTFYNLYLLILKLNFAKVFLSKPNQKPYNFMFILKFQIESQEVYLEAHH